MCVRGNRQQKGFAAKRSQYEGKTRQHEKSLNSLRTNCHKFCGATTDTNEVSEEISFGNMATNHYKEL